jgi:hypothetical protein
MIEENYTKMGKDYCPACDYKCDSASVVDGQHQVPMPGDYSICLNCGEWLEFSSDMALIIMPDETRKKLDEESEKTLIKTSSRIKGRGKIK